MSRGGDPQNTYDEPGGYNDAYERQQEDRSGSLFPYSVPWGGWSTFFGRGRGVDDEYADRATGGDTVGTYEGEDYEGTYDEDAYGETTADSDDDGGGSWWEEGLAGTLILVGVVLFFIPEPATSMLGIALISLGVLTWVVDALT